MSLILGESAGKVSKGLPLFTRNRNGAVDNCSGISWKPPPTTKVRSKSIQETATLRTSQIGAVNCARLKSNKKQSRFQGNGQRLLRGKGRAFTRLDLGRFVAMKILFARKYLKVVVCLRPYAERKRLSGNRVCDTSLAWPGERRLNWRLWVCKEQRRKGHASFVVSSLA